MYQQVMTTWSLDDASTRNLLSNKERGRDGGGMKSHGTSTKSSEMREEKWRSRAQVPSCSPSSNEWTSIRRDEGELFE